MEKADDRMPACPHKFTSVKGLGTWTARGCGKHLYDVLGDDHNPSALVTKPGFTLGNGQVPGVGFFAPHDLPPVVVKLPHL